MKDMRSSDPGMEVSNLNIKGGKGTKGKPTKGEDCTIVEQTSNYVYKSSYCINLSTGENIMAKLIDGNLSSWFKSPPSSST